MQVGELGEQRLGMDALFVDEPEVGVVQHDDDLLALRGHGLHRCNDALRVLERGRVARRVVREVEDEDLLVAGGQERALHRRHVERARAEHVERGELRAAHLLEDERVVVPVEVRRHHLVAQTGEQLARHAQTMGEGVRYDGEGVVLPAQGGVLLHLHLLPRLAERQKAETSGIEEGLAVEIRMSGETVHHERGAVLLERHADRRVDRARLRLGSLTKDAPVGEIDATADRREHVGHRSQFCVQLFCQCVHGRIVYHNRRPAWE